MIYHRQLPKYLAFLFLSVVLGSDLVIPQVFAQTSVQTSVSKGVSFTCNDSEATIKAKNGPRVVSGTTSIYIGYQQVSSSNKDPRIIRFDNGIKKWCRSDYETTTDDGTGYGLLWAGSVLYGVFTSTGTQTGNDFRRFSTGRWLSSYGSGGGAKVAVIARINPDNGTVNYATFFSAKKITDGKTNSLVVKSLSWNGANLTVQADSWSSPRRANTNSMTCTGSSPYKYTVVFTGDLTKVNSASAVNCT
ncbi:hypothetical protein I8748_03905 [Nostoc sp. CENA67]|uniref:Uncharacterized protein n=1 Tax=Amazonocrinis nigriterrae CENA67 TaxID=2794033 RepID=A0A8J7HKM2_9NOST|nr:hypothetical protein [Amazonocrinis nigriterrae]MBH8561328.1 hypothetical protein [Amazonocrinis nigriterrae CENA67]